MAEGIADLYLKNIFKSYRLLEDIISDRGSQFVFKFMWWLLELGKLKGNWSTVYHSQLDRQIERIN